MTSAVYFGREVATTGATEVLETLDTQVLGVPEGGLQVNAVPGVHEARVNQSTGGRARLASKAWTCSALRQQPRGQSNSTGRPFTQPTAAAR